MYRINHNAKSLVSHGVSTCAGCGLELAIRVTLSAVGEDTIVVIPPGCAALFSGFGKDTGVKVAGYQCNLENVASTAAGIRASLTAQNNDHTTVLCFAGDGATVDIGVQALSGALERRDRIMYVCYDNEAYMNTGVQSSSSTPMYAHTNTSPNGKPTGRKDLIGIAIAHLIPYAATASVCKPADLKRKLMKAKEINGPSLIHIHAPCPTGWQYPPEKTIELSKSAVQTGSWLLYEYENGKTTVNYRPKEWLPVENYLSMQKRFDSMSEEEKRSLSELTVRNIRETLNRLDAMKGGDMS